MRLVVIDEIQRIPILLNEVHRLIETRGVRFLLTGSSARKLRRGGVNLLGGRARTKYLHPLTFHELGLHFDLKRAVERGTIPAIYFSDDAQSDLHAYSGSYLQQEIVAEEKKFKRYLCVSLEARTRKLEGITVLPVKEFLKSLWEGEYV